MSSLLQVCCEARMRGNSGRKPPGDVKLRSNNEISGNLQRLPVGATGGTRHLGQLLARDLGVAQRQ
jgi:hypothetical protein